jgi:hypothetical protein
MVDIPVASPPGLRSLRTSGLSFTPRVIMVDSRQREQISDLLRECLRLKLISSGRVLADAVHIQIGSDVIDLPPDDARAFLTGALESLRFRPKWNGGRPGDVA